MKPLPYTLANGLWLAVAGAAAAGGQPPAEPMLLHGEVLVGSSGQGTTLKASIAGRTIETQLVLGAEGLTSYQFLVPARDGARPDVVGGSVGDTLTFVAMGNVPLTSSLPWSPGMVEYPLRDDRARPPRPGLATGAAAAVAGSGGWSLSCSFTPLTGDPLTLSWQYRWLGLGPVGQDGRPSVEELANGEIRADANTGQGKSVTCGSKTLTRDLAGFSRVLLVVTPIGAAGLRGFSAVRDAVRGSAPGTESKL